MELRKLQRSWAEICCLGCTCLQLWPKIVLRKWLNISSRDSDFSADEADTTESEFDDEGHPKPQKDRFFYYIQETEKELIFSYKKIVDP